MARRVLATWGNGDHGRLGYAGSSELPRLCLSALLEGVAGVACGGSHTCVHTGTQSTIPFAEHSKPNLCLEQPLSAISICHFTGLHSAACQMTAAWCPWG